VSDRRPPGRTLTENVVGATLWNTLLLPARAVVSLFTSVVYYSVLSRSDVGLIFLLQGLANTLGVYVDLGIERTLPRFLPEVDAARGRAGVSRLLGRALIAKLLVLLPVLLGLFVFSDELVRALAERQLSSAAPASADALRVASSSRPPWPPCSRQGPSTTCSCRP
jgi:O-antigen/teichoic acid export membrane protein